MGWLPSCKKRSNGHALDPHAGLGFHFAWRGRGAACPAPHGDGLDSAGPSKFAGCMVEAIARLMRTAQSELARPHHFRAHAGPSQARGPAVDERVGQIPSFYPGGGMRRRGVRAGGICPGLAENRKPGVGQCDAVVAAGHAGAHRAKRSCLMRTVWRITTAHFAKSAFSGEGARLQGGRWNPKGLALGYSAVSQALALLEMMAQDALCGPAVS